MDTSRCKKFLVDGYPRNADNREGWEKAVGDSATLAGVLYFDCPEETLVERCIARGKAAGAAARSDDNAEAMVKRLRTYRCRSPPPLLLSRALPSSPFLLCLCPFGVRLPSDGAAVLQPARNQRDDIQVD